MAQQAFQGDLDNDPPVAGVLDQQPFLHERLDQGVAGRRQVGVAGQSAHRLIVAGVDGGQPRDERIVQKLELDPPGDGVGGEQGVHLGLHHLRHPAHRLVLPRGQVAAVAEIVVETLQGQRQQRQRIGPCGRIGQHPVHQRGFDTQPPARCGGAAGRTGDDLLEPRRRHRFELVEHHALYPGQLRCGLQLLVAVGADGDRHDQPRGNACLAAQQASQNVQEAGGLRPGVSIKEFLALIQRQHQGGCGLIGGHLQQPGTRGLAGLGQPAPQPLDVAREAGVFDLPQQRRGQTQPGAQVVDGGGETEFAGEHCVFGAHDVHREELVVVAAQPGQQPGPQKRRLPRPGGAQDHQQ